MVPRWLVSKAGIVVNDEAGGSEESRQIESLSHSSMSEALVGELEYSGVAV
jgi:hypothetical protein